MSNTTKIPRKVSSMSTTRMSSRGQVVIPETIRRRFGFRTGSRFVVVGDRNVVVLKEITAPSLDDFDDIIAEARRQARDAGMKRSDIRDAISRARRRS